MDREYNNKKKCELNYIREIHICAEFNYLHHGLT